MIGTEFFQGQGFGNQLFCYVTARCVALDNNSKFGTISQKLFGAPRWNKNGAYFMDVDLGIDAVKNDFDKVYIEKSYRHYTDKCIHDVVHGCDISVYDEGLSNVSDSTLIFGNMQSEKYFIHRKEEIKEWLKVKPVYDSYEFCNDNLCIMNMRGGEYVGLKELFLEKEYWLNSMLNMRKINPQMQFMIITDDIQAAQRVLPDIPAYHFDIAKDYVSIKNARYLILSNSSFAFFPAFTSDTVKYIIAPKYWARHNVSDGYWATGQNIYTGWNYQDINGKLFTSNECNSEFEVFKEQSGIYKFQTKPMVSSKFSRFFKKIKTKYF
jgi:hypothetical protein